MTPWSLVVTALQLQHYNSNFFIFSTGIEHVLVGAFGDVERVEDGWLDDLNKQGMIDPNWYAFSELFDGDDPEGHAIPQGLLKIKVGRLE